MKPLTPYLLFDGTCREAMTFYQQCIGGDLEIMTYAESPEGVACPPGQSEGILHASLTNGELVLMASDDPTGGPVRGTNIHLSLSCENMEDLQRLFRTIGEGGEVVMPLADTFWGAHFGMLTDKFGIQWMLSYPLPSATVR